MLRGVSGTSAPAQPISRRPNPRRPPGQHKQRAEGEEAEVVGELVASAFANVVDLKNVVVDNAFDKVEGARTASSDESAAADRPPPVRGASPEDVDARGDGDPGRGVEDPVPEGARLEPGNGAGRELPSLLSM